jgi:hypothetical protein
MKTAYDILKEEIAISAETAQELFNYEYSRKQDKLEKALGELLSVKNKFVEALKIVESASKEVKEHGKNN